MSDYRNGIEMCSECKVNPATMWGMCTVCRNDPPPAPADPAPCDLAAIRARLAAITPGPRRVRIEEWEAQAYVDLPNGDVITFDTDCAPDDAAFDAAAPIDIAALLAEVDRLQDELAALRLAQPLADVLTRELPRIVDKLQEAPDA